MNVGPNNEIINVTGSPVQSSPSRRRPRRSGRLKRFGIAKLEVGAAMTPAEREAPPGVERATTFTNGDTAKLVVFADKTVTGSRGT